MTLSVTDAGSKRGALAVAEALGQVVLESPLLRRLRSDDLARLGQSGRLVQLALGDALSPLYGAPALLRVVIDGQLNLYPSRASTADFRVVERVTAGGFVGESPDLTPSRLPLSASAGLPTTILEAPLAALSHALRRDAKLWSLLAETLDARHVALGLSCCSLIEEMPEEVRQSLVAQGSVVGFVSGQRVLRAGVRSSSLYIVLSGQLEARAPGARRTLPRSTGELVGEMSTYGDGELFDVVAVDKTRLLQLPRRVFAELISTHPTVLERLSSLVDERIRVAGAVCSEQPPRSRPRARTES